MVAEARVSVGLAGGLPSLRNQDHPLELENAGIYNRTDIEKTY